MEEKTEIVELTETDILNLTDMINTYVMKVGFYNVSDCFKGTIYKIMLAQERFDENGL
ncbi:hypothetical protein [Enterococcus faecalis]